MHGEMPNLIEISLFEVFTYYYRNLAWYKNGNKANAITDFGRVIILDARWWSAYITMAFAE
jgi:hypothetical protein